MTERRIVSPLLLLLLARLFGREAFRIDPIGMVGALLIAQLLPLLLGLLLRHRSPRLAEWLARPLELVSKILNLSVVVAILVSQFHMLAQIRLRGFVGMLMLLSGTLAIGRLAGRAQR